MMLTGYARLVIWQARAALAGLALAAVFCVGVAISPLWQGKVGQDRHGVSDVALYRAEVERIHNGEGYYQAAAAELTARGYPTKSVFNWRMPLPVWFIGQLPKPDWAKYLLGAFALGLIVLAFEALAREEENLLYNSEATVQLSPQHQKIGKQSPQLQETEKLSPQLVSHRSPLFVPIFCVILLSGPLILTVLGDIYVMPVLWSGIFIALSICVYGLGKPYIGLAFALAALFLRELALPYYALCAWLAWREKRWKELFIWCVGLAAWAAFFGWHFWLATSMIAPDAFAHPNGWIRAGGAGFVLATAQVNAYLLLLPPWTTALYFVAGMFGLAGWNTKLGTRLGLSACLYVLFFSIVGQDFNQYWGAIIGPMLCFGAARFPRSISDLWHAAEIVTPTRAPTSLQ